MEIWSVEKLREMMSDQRTVRVDVRIEDNCTLVVSFEGYPDIVYEADDEDDLGEKYNYVMNRLNEALDMAN